MKNILRIGAISLVLGGLTVGSANGQTSTTNPPAARKAASEATGAEKKQVAGPFHGKLAKIDKVAKTITVGKRTFQITSATKIKKADGTPATLNDAVVGEEVGGYIKPTEDGKWNATTVTLGVKTGGQKAKKPAGEKEQK